MLIRLALTDELRRQGYLVIEAANADDAVAVLQSGTNVNLLFSDVRMPGTMDGIALARLVCAEFPMVHVVLTSGYLVSEDVPDCVRLTFGKPYDFPELIRQIGALLS